MNSIYGSPMKTYSSSPDIPHMNSFELAEDETSSTTSQCDDRLDYSQNGAYYQSGGDYSRPFRPSFRPKTPPPPPPPPPQVSIPQNLNSQRLPSSSFSSGNHVKQNSSGGLGTMHIVVPSADDSDRTPSPPPLPQSSPPSSSSSNIVPPPPPPPPPNLLKIPSASSTTSVGVSKAGISVEALRSVSLKKAEPDDRKSQVPVGGMVTSGSVDFQADLRNALAKRRSKVALEQEEEDKSEVNGRFGGLSLRESVRENVQTKDVKQHSPPGIANKKDSGYTSSRTSLEPSEYGEDRSDANAHRPHFSVDSSSSRNNVALISQNIEDNYGARKNIDNMSVSSTLSTLSGCSSESRPTPSLIPVVPPIDYDDPDSGTGGSDSDMQNAEGGSFERKVLLKWTCADALQWLISL
ncbi:SAM domain-containing protein, partial [Trichostrongylus colubriformis]